MDCGREVRHERSYRFPPSSVSHEYQEILESGSH